MARWPHLPATPKTPALVSAVRDWSGWLVVAAGAVLCVLGWYGISGESVVEQQLPYLASATIPGAALIVAGAMLVIFRPARRIEQADRRIETLYTLLVTDAVAADAAASGAPREDVDGPGVGADTLLAVPGGTLYHRRDCPLIAGKPTAEVIDAAAAAERSLAPCPVCEPPVVPPAGAGDPDPGQAGR
jgi:hypothetical protein